ncbi:MAG TPA: hypothetical protein VJH91_01700 [Candidatus Paceibacterota bacterium]
MSATSTYGSRALLFALILGLVAALVPFRVHAQGVIPTFRPVEPCISWMRMPPQTRPPVMACYEMTPLGPVAGFCIAVQCKGTQAPGLGGGSMSLGGSLQGIVGALLSGVIGKLMQPTPPTPTPPAYPGGGTTPTPISCNIYATVASSTASSTTYILSWTTSGGATSATISPLPGPVSPFGSQQITAPAATTFFLTVTGSSGSNTCSSAGGYGPNSYSGVDQNSISNLLNGLGGNSNISNLLNQLGGDLGGSNLQPVSDLLNQFGPSLPGLPPRDTSAASGTPPLSQNIFTHPAPLMPSGTSGDIRITNEGVTLIVRSRDPDKNTEVAGFYGSNTLTGQNPTGLVANLCRTRPWATNLLSYVVPANFFDGLCTWRGYQVGLPVPSAPQVTVTQTRPKPTQQTSTTTAPVVEARVDIWAVPVSVPLGARTSIFWNTQGVASCIISSPDGSFNQSTLSGGASTVPLTGATMYTISCLKADSTPVTDYVMVNLAI